MENGAGGEGPVASAGSGSRKHELVPQLQLPPGFRYVPTDEELVDVYLRCKIEGRTPPLDIVNEVDIMRSDPQKLIVREPSKTNKKDEPNRKVVVDGVEVGGWIATGSVTKIYRTSRLMDQETIIGTKRILTYRSILSAEDNKWSMHEYIMSGKSQMGQYALCAIQLKQTYEAEKKVEEEGKSGNEGKRRVARKGMRENRSTCQGQEEQHETSSLGKITDDTYPLEVGNVEDYTQSQLCNQDNGDVFFGAFEDSTNELHDTFVLSRQERNYNDAIDQSMAIQHVGEDCMGDGDAKIYYADDISSFHTNNDSLLDVDGDHVREPEM
ncbi:hypothetical protein E2562_011233 [Oryza meyeriana var. granulata]|uniref:NAC domain-containing protein n=1 Tax=Oryza meyeriana var. granulata TaxID=110450 RepID=A0A6G1DGR8_9ORYZ|nr:hypothetical protein E2562_011233 [Oryza meyeriana var. granulata]